MTRSTRIGAVGLTALAVAGAARAQADAGADAAPPAPKGACVEHIPEGKARPTLRETLPARGLSGHVAVLEVVVEHGKGEAVLPDAIRVQSGGDEIRAIETAGFVLPDPDGGAGPTVTVQEAGDRASTTVRIPVVPLPPKPGRQTLELPPLPIAMARASGEVITLCTQPHAIVVEDPIANTPDAKPKDNPEPRRQRELWMAAKQVALASLVALVVGALVAWLVGRWLRRPRPVPPPPPPRPPWEVALEELHDVRHAGLVEAGRHADHFDRVSFAIRRYLGDRYGFDGLESTTRETLSVVRRVVPKVEPLREIERFLRQADLVKFARLTPTAEQCESALAEAESIVHRTIPAFEPPPDASPEPVPAATEGEPS
jgi:hypothetical protein